MAQSTSNGPPPLPTWLLVVGSLLIVGHLGIMGVSALAERSGPWVTLYGTDTAMPPTFAVSIDEVTRPWYLRPLKMTNTYHFVTNRAENWGVRFRVKLRDEAGHPFAELSFPDENANPWVRHRQDLLAMQLLQEQPVQVAGEVIAAPGQSVDVPIWEMGPDRVYQLRPTPQHLVPRDRPVSRPTEVALLLARSYARHLCRKHGAASAEIVRQSRYPIPPLVLFQPELPPGTTDEMVASFGEMTP